MSTNVKIVFVIIACIFGLVGGVMLTQKIQETEVKKINLLDNQQAIRVYEQMDTFAKVNFKYIMSYYCKCINTQDSLSAALLMEQMKEQCVLKTYVSRDVDKELRRIFKFDENKELSRYRNSLFAALLAQHCPSFPGIREDQ